MSKRSHGPGQKKPANASDGQPFYVGAQRRKGKKRSPDKRRREINSLKRET